MEEDDTDIATAMGFSSFGGTKKRKYDQASSPKPPTKADASGANSMQLGMRTKKTADTSSDAHDCADDAATASAPATSTVPQPKKQQAAGLADFLARAQTNSTSAQSDHSASEMVSFGGPAISKADLNALKFGVKNETGDTAYFLPNFVGDPWEGMK